MTSNRHQLIELIEQGAIEKDKINDALIISQVQPRSNDWLNFFIQSLAWLGGLAITFSVLFFVAFNWDEMGKFAKFALVELLVILAVAAYYKLNALTHQASISSDNSIIKSSVTSKFSKVSESVTKVPLFMAAIFFGVLLALFGQTYQTGADPWQLFFNWAVLILPWVIIGRLSALWMLWIGLINLSILLYYMNFSGTLGFFINQELNSLWVIFFFNTLVLACWELLSQRYTWLSARWAPRLLAIASGTCISWLMVGSILGFSDESYLSSGFSEIGILPVMIWPMWLIAMYLGYRKYQQDLFMLAGILVSVNIVVICFVLSHWLEAIGEIGFLLISNMMIAMAAGSAIWLRKINKEWQS
ncbi:DUF2157 domain-containing protein [Shewanella sp. 10N.286.52.B9]|uniref:DUF2157 domain-containing protein n=1 Tax=Shewanella sp. 10N.286.52.B9 TaxID=1880837 RepID=UPI000CBF6A87|nr:DUF2157 domain-containing protein [Shewanella sp. 10N.286.52.B9]PMG41979.1 hypothetical protein BCU91_09270 [Shewanella sp. 10N.286.52.B9]